jgi:DNA-binding transcriptional MerR regulator
MVTMTMKQLTLMTRISQPTLRKWLHAGIIKPDATIGTRRLFSLETALRLSAAKAQAYHPVKKGILYAN